LSAEQMRMNVMYYYRNNPDFKEKLKHMPDNQVIAIFHRLVREGKLRV